MRTRAVAERAGVNAALVHYHFGSMETLLREAVLARLQPELGGLVEPLTEELPFGDALIATFQRVDGFDLDSEAGILLAEALLRATRDAVVAEAMAGEVRAWRHLVEPRIVRAQAEGEVRDDLAASTLAMIVAAALDGFVLQRMAERDGDETAVANGLVRLLAPIGEG